MVRIFKHVANQPAKVWEVTDLHTLVQDDQGRPTPMWRIDVPGAKFYSVAPVQDGVVWYLFHTFVV